MDDDIVIDLRALPPTLDLTDSRPTFEIVVREQAEPRGGGRAGIDQALDELIAGAVGHAVHDSLTR